MTTVKTNNLGFPRIGAQRELKKATELFWNKKSSDTELLAVARRLRKQNWSFQKDAGIDFIPSNDFSLYDQVLDMSVLLGAIPSRYQTIPNRLDRYFAMARGIQDPKAGIDLPAMEMTKWFDTNYHYIVPELELTQTFSLDPTKLLTELKEARALGVETRPVIIGPVSFLLLSKMANEGTSPSSCLELLDQILPVYEQLLKVLASEKVEWVQVDEPSLVLELTEQSKVAYETSLSEMMAWTERPKIFIATYFDSLKENIDLVARSKCDGLHIDLVRAPSQLDSAISALPENTVLSVGLIDGRNIWRTDLEVAHSAVKTAVSKLGAHRVWVGPSCSLIHTPVDLSLETKLDGELKAWLSFGVQKLSEIRALADIAEMPSPEGPTVEECRKILQSRRSSNRVKNQVVRNRIAAITPTLLSRAFQYPVRAERQKRLNLPICPTTTIGSFPQTEEVRKARANWRSGKLSQQEYDRFLKMETRSCIEKQEELGLDVLVHGEFERTDMVEYFGEQLSGFAFTSNGWVQSYGSRCVKPPVIFGDVTRPLPMTVDWTSYAQSLTQKPVKGMLTGPVTILQWSFVRDDQPRSTTCTQIGLALRDEVRDLESAGISVIQVDEPAIREGLPLRKSDWKAYLRWAVDAFKLATSGVRLSTQIHTHMCYSEFGDILDSVVEMDADVLSIETSRSRMELLKDFKTFHYPNEVGPGVYDIHSPRVPAVSEILDLLERASQVIALERLWVNPDCGLKTRAWPEVERALENMVAAAQQFRELHLNPKPAQKRQSELRPVGPTLSKGMTIEP